VLEDADIKLASVATDALGASGRAMLDALIRGDRELGDVVRASELATACSGSHREMANREAGSLCGLKMKELENATRLLDVRLMVRGGRSLDDDFPLIAPVGAPPHQANGP
jgi:hypothetical protein